MDCSSNRLLELPTELFEAVIRHLEAEQISWLRLTCKYRGGFIIDSALDSILDKRICPQIVCKD